MCAEVSRRFVCYTPQLNCTNDISYVLHVATTAQMCSLYEFMWPWLSWCTGLQNTIRHNIWIANSLWKLPNKYNWRIKCVYFLCLAYFYVWPLLQAAVMITKKRNRKIRLLTVCCSTYRVHLVENYVNFDFRFWWRYTLGEMGQRKRFSKTPTKTNHVTYSQILVWCMSRYVWQITSSTY